MSYDTVLKFYNIIIGSYFKPQSFLMCMFTNDSKHASY